MASHVQLNRFKPVTFDTSISRRFTDLLVKESIDRTTVSNLSLSVPKLKNPKISLRGNGYKDQTNPIISRSFESDYGLQPIGSGKRLNTTGYDAGEDSTAKDKKKLF